MRVKDEDGNDNLLYGTDFEKDEPRHWYSGINTTAMTGSNAYFCANGVINALREPHPQYWEVRHVYQPIVITAIDIEAGTYNIRSRFLFTDTSSYKCKWTIESEGEPILSGELDRVSVSPLGEDIINIPYDYSALPPGKECVLTISFLTKKKTLGLKQNTEIAFDQFILTNAAKPVLSADGTALGFDKNGNSVTIKGDNFSVSVNNGRIESYVIGGNEVLKAPIAPNYFRALTDNDIDMLNFAPPAIQKMHRYYKWQKATNSVKAVNTEVEQKDGAIKVKCVLSVYNMKDAFVTYTVYADGRIAVYHSATPKAELLRMGFKFDVDRSLDTVSWYGRGPAPCYCDRKTGYKIGKYSMPIQSFEYSYMRPQEASTRADARFFTLTDKNGSGIKITAYFDKPIMFSALPYSPDMLDSFTHINEINRDNDITVTVDSIQQGIGGDMPGQAFVRDKYKVKANEKQCVFFLIEKK